MVHFVYHAFTVFFSGISIVKMVQSMEIVEQVSEVITTDLKFTV